MYLQAVYYGKQEKEVLYILFCGLETRSYDTRFC